MFCGRSGSRDAGVSGEKARHELMHLGECRSCLEIGVQIGLDGRCEMCASIPSMSAPTAGE